MKKLLTTNFVMIVNILFNKHVPSILFSALGPITIVALVFLAAKPSFADMQYIDGFEIDRTEVTVGKFRKFVTATGYITAAEKNGGGMVYDTGWKKMNGWFWSSPFGIAAKLDEPAVHVTFDDAEAYCYWAGKRLPKDKEWAKAAFTEFRSNPPTPFVKGVSYL